jgi:hypothetical protein
MTRKALERVRATGHGRDGAVVPAAVEGGALTTRHAKAKSCGALPPLREANGPADDSRQAHDAFAPLRP